MVMVMMAIAPTGAAQKPPLLPEKNLAALAEELSGETAKRTIEGISRNHRTRGSRPFRAAAGLVAERGRADGLGGGGMPANRRSGKWKGLREITGREARGRFARRRS